MSFDLLAPHYRWMEFVLAGSKLQRCRTAFLHSVAGAQKVLSVGEGNGRFLTECRRRLEVAQITCVDASARMLSQARRRLESHGLSRASTEFIHADILDWTPPPRTFDLVVTHFFLDCFTPGQLTRVIQRIAAAAVPEATWLLADFQIPATRFRRYRSQAIHWLMYAFFRRATGLAAHRLTSPDAALRANGFVLRRHQETEWGLLRSQEWKRGAPVDRHASSNEERGRLDAK